MSNAEKLLSMFMVPGTALGTTIAALNIYNLRKSPIYRPDGSNTVRLALGVGVKSVIYSTFWPIATYGIVRDMYKENKDFEKHFIPFSVYGKD